jgi:hypothetical protein
LNQDAKRRLIQLNEVSLEKYDASAATPGVRRQGFDLSKGGGDNSVPVQVALPLHEAQCDGGIGGYPKRATWHARALRQVVQRCWSIQQCLKEVHCGHETIRDLKYQFRRDISHGISLFTSRHVIQAFCGRTPALSGGQSLSA